MIESQARDRQAERREATRAEILETAWDLARSEGLAGFSMGDVARRMGMKTPSLYWYFDSKHAVYDAMFLQGNHQLLASFSDQEWGTSPRDLLRRLGRVWVEFCIEDLARYQLLFQRTIPDFEPSQDAYAVAIKVVEIGQSMLRSIGIRKAAHFDLWTALIAGLAAQQTSNQPHGDRWLRLVDPVVDMFLASVDADRSVRVTSGR